jgi:hypothetical protein
MIPFFLDEELRGNELRDFRKHIAGCTNCKELLAEEEALSRLLHHTRPLYQAPEALRTRVSAAMAMCEATVGVRGLRRAGNNATRKRSKR